MKDGLSASPHATMGQRERGWARVHEPPASRQGRCAQFDEDALGMQAFCRAERG